MLERSCGWRRRALPIAALVAMILPVRAPAAATGREAPVTPGGSLTLETAGVLDGGVHNGAIGRALLYLDGSIKSGTLGWWHGGRMYASGLFIRDGGPIDVVGDVQGVSNVAAPPAARVYQAWFSQTFGASGLTAKAGLIDLNHSFVVTEDAANLLNSSFGIMPTITGNAPTSIFPEPGCGATVEMARGRWIGRVGLFQGDPARRFQPGDNGHMAVAEARCRAFGGDWTAGIWEHAGRGAGAGERWGGYLLVQHPLGTRRLNGFLQLGEASGSSAPVPNYLGAGFDFKGPVANRPDDHLVLGIARASIRDEDAETSYELGYLARLTGTLTLQPDIQYVTHPAGRRRDTLVAFLRLGLVFQ